MSLWWTELVSSPVALYTSWVDHRDVLVWTLSATCFGVAMGSPLNWATHGKHIYVFERKENLDSEGKLQLYSPRNDPDPEMIPNPEMIPKSTPK